MFIRSPAVIVFNVFITFLATVVLAAGTVVTIDIVIDVVQNGFARLRSRWTELKLHP